MENKLFRNKVSRGPKNPLPLTFPVGIIRCRFPKLKSLSEIIPFRYGNDVLKLIRKYENHDCRLCKIHLDITLLNSCLGNDLCPTFLCYRLSPKRLQNSESYRLSQYLFLQEEIIFKTIEREKIIRKLQKIKNDIRTVMKFIYLTHMSNKFTEINIKGIKRVEEVQNYKFSEQSVLKVIYNFSSYDSAQTKISQLLKDLKFYLPQQKLKSENPLLSCACELSYRDVMNDEKKDNDDTLMHLKSWFIIF